MSDREDLKVIVTRQPGDHRTAEVPLSRLYGWRWTTASGGVLARLRRPTLAAYVQCTDLEDQPFGHTCQHGPPPHEIKVLALKSHNRSTYRRLAALAPARKS